MVNMEGQNGGVKSIGLEGYELWLTFVRELLIPYTKNLLTISA
jgi:hypothetical protein